MPVELRPNKACPVVLRGADRSEVLVFRHPLAGIQLVKGGIEPGEAPGAAALRELREEAGISTAQVERDLGLWDSGHTGQVWSLHLCRVTAVLPERWTFQTADDGGQRFEFFWHPLQREASSAWHPLFQAALSILRQRL